MKGLDLSFAQPPASWWTARYAEGWRVAVVNLWTGLASPTPARANLANARAAGFSTAGYTVVNMQSAATAVNKAVGAAGAEWGHLDFISVDVEVPTTPAIVRQAVDGLRALGKKVCIYTGGWFWNWFMLQQGGNFDFSDVPAWLADYDSSPALDTARLGRLGSVIGKQYRGTTQLAGYAVDLNTFGDGFITGQEDEHMTKQELADLFRAAALDGLIGADNAIVGRTKLRAIIDAQAAEIAALKARPVGAGVTLAQVRAEIEGATLRAKA